MDKEYIERKKARELIDNYGKNAVDLGRWSLDPVDDIIALTKGVDKIPTADVVEVVRCKGCQFGKYDDEQNMILCKRILNITDGEHFVYNKLDDFCSYGIRKED